MKTKSTVGRLLTHFSEWRESGNQKWRESGARVAREWLEQTLEQTLRQTLRQSARKRRVRDAQHTPREWRLCCSYSAPPLYPHGHPLHGIRQGMMKAEGKCDTGERLTIFV